MKNRNLFKGTCKLSLLVLVCTAVLGLTQTQAQTTGTVYFLGANQQTPPSPNQLFRLVNPGTGSTTSVPVGSATSIRLAQLGYYNGNLYSVVADSTVVMINPATGAISYTGIILPTGYNYAGGDVYNGIFYLTNIGTSIPGGGFNLFRVNLSTSVVTILPSIRTGDVAYYNGYLYGLQSGTTTQVYCIDTATGVATAVGPTSTGIGSAGAAWSDGTGMIYLAGGVTNATYNVNTNTFTADPNVGAGNNPPVYGGYDGTWSPAAFTTTTVSGNIFSDPAGNSTGTTGTNAGGVYVSLVDNGGTVVATVPVNANGTYTFTGVTPGTYAIAVTTNPSGSATPSLPAGWASTGEGYQAADPVVDGKINNIVVASTPITGANFMAEQLPTAGTATPTLVNPGGTSTIDITSYITGTDPDGTVAQVHFTTYPTNMTSITIGGTTYTSANWPAGGVTVPYGTTVLIDPVDGTASPVVPFKVIDNAGKESTNGGSVTVTLAAPPDLTPSLDIDALSFSPTSGTRDFVVNIFEINGSIAGNPISVRLAKISAFTITYPAASGTSNVFGGTTNENSNWNFTENTNFITATAKPGVTIPANGTAVLGFTVARKPGVTNGTSQALTTTIVGLSGGETNTTNNKNITSFTATP
jgi:hypothetical protein